MVPAPPILDQMPSLQTPVRRTIQRATSARIALAYRAHDRFMGNRASVRRYKAEPGQLGPVQQRVVEDLRRDGISLVPFSELVGDDGLWRELEADMNTFVAQAEADRPAGDGAPRDKDDYLIRRFRRLTKERRQAGVTPPEPELAPDSPWLRLATSPALLDVANAYRGMWTKLVDTDHWYTVPSGASHDRVGSQRWHRDPEDQHVLKVFLYFNDVDDDAGPFQYVAGSAEGARYGHLWPWTVTGETYPPQEELAREIPDSEHVTAKGPAGTLIFCDTSGFHRGGFARSSPRILSYFTYVSPASLLSQRQTRSFRLEAEPSGGLRPPVAFALD
jgi:hypothetical protein